MKKKIKVALVGNPNSGKSSLFNELTGLNQKIANFPGVTVEKKTGICSIKNLNGDTVEAEIIDLPGTYSLYPKSIDEQIPFQILCDPANALNPDVVIVIADASNLKRSLFLCSQVVDLKRQVILALNMMDLVQQKGLEINIPLLAHKLGITVLQISAREGKGIEELKNAILVKQNIPAHYFIDVKKIAPDVVGAVNQMMQTTSDYHSFQIVCNLKALTYFDIQPQKKKHIEEVLQNFQFDATPLQAKETLDRYTAITVLMNECVKQVNEAKENSFQKKIDHILLHRFWGYIFFMIILFLIFQSIFSIAQYPMQWFDTGVAAFSQWLDATIPKGELNDLIINGVIAGLAGIVIFIPQIALLFFFIALLEDSGYMARVSFIMDKMMRKFGLNGRSVIPLISGVACAVPAILSTRTISGWKERMITILVTPLMSCSARLPVYTLLISLIIPSEKVWGVINMQGLVLMALYLIGFLAAIGSSLLMKFLIKARERTFFMMEIPVYRMPRWKNIGISILDKVKIFLFDAGKVIIAISIILWVLSSHAPGKRMTAVETKYETLKKSTGSNPAKLDNQMQAEKLESSYAGIMGKWLEPVIKPLGFDWKIGIALITSFAAREVFVGTMSTIYSVGKNNQDQLTVRDKMMAEKSPLTGLPRYSLSVGLSLMLFYAFALQCMSTLAVVKRETGGWKLPILQFLYMGILAYLASFTVYQILS